MNTSIQDNSSIDNEVNLQQILFIALKRKKLFTTILIISFAASLLAAILMPDIYKSQAVLAPANQETSLSSMLGSYSSLAGLAGFNLPNEPEDKTLEAIERISSFNFFSNYFLPNIKLENLMAVKKWDAKNNVVIYKNRIFNKEKGIWVRKEKFPRKAKPSNQEAYEVYLDLINVAKDNNTGFVKISIESHSPDIAKNWLDLIIFYINESMRLEDKEITLDYINYLNKVFSETTISELQEAIAQLLQAQMQKYMVTEYSKDYIFKEIEPPLAEEEESSPNRVLILIMGLIFGLIAAISTNLILNIKDEHK